MLLGLLDFVEHNAARLVYSEESDQCGDCREQSQQLEVRSR